MKRLMLISIALSVLSIGCEMQYFMEIYIDEIKDVHTQKIEIPIEAKMRFEIPTKDFIDEKGSEILSIMRKYFTVKGDLKHESESMNDYCIILIDMKLGCYDNEVVEGEDIFSMKVKHNDDEKRLDLMLMVNKEKYKQLNDDLSSKFMSGFDPDEITVNLTVRNEEKKPVELVVWSCWLTGEPVPYTEYITVQRRKPIEVKPSKIAMSWGMQTGFIPIFGILEIDPQIDPVKTPTPLDEGVNGETVNKTMEEIGGKGERSAIAEHPSSPVDTDVLIKQRVANIIKMRKEETLECEERNVLDQEMQEYYIKLIYIVRSNWEITPKSDIDAGGNPAATVAFRISRNGTILGIEYLEHSDQESFEEAVEATLNLAKLPPLPANYSGEYIDIGMMF